MNCPKCEHELVSLEKHNIEVDFCEKCKGMWLDYEELDQLEDISYNQDCYKGSLLSRKEGVSFKCPKCEELLVQFKYRFNDLTLEYCPDGHGFWLDEGEDVRVLELMKQREKDMDRTFRAEAQFFDFLNSLRKKSFFSKIKNLFK